ncbi:Radical SAM domain protein [Caldicellulosiruptor acetigenus 6A]|uniref:Radical SAM domain protein n=1 Tax=Caldicellulosiruptor acetigenus 6A TaxID=632516 RepID=G2PTL3_9FIRM|nr:Radical SAM domain protein [Caldicellulosiruptor acetigenus 6A]
MEVDKIVNVYRILSKIIEDNYPIEIVCEITRKCTWDCRFCYIEKHEEGELKTDEYFNILDELSSMGTFVVTITGGEPLLRNDIFDIANYARKKGMGLILYTNGELIQDSVVAKDITRLFGKIEISIHAGEPSIHDFLVRKEGAWEKALNAVYLLKIYNANVVIKTVVTKQGLPSLKKLEEIVSKLNVEWFADVEIAPTYSGDYFKRSMYMLNFDEVKTFRSMFEKFSRTIKENSSKKRITCKAGRSSFFIDYKGYVYPCPEFVIDKEHYIKNVDNLKEKSFKEIINGNTLIEEIRKVKDDAFQKCLRCELLHDCVVCIAKNYKYWNDITYPSPLVCIQTLFNNIYRDKLTPFLFR